MNKKEASIKYTAEKMKELIGQYLKMKGLAMSKQISSGSSGFLSYTEPTYDNRTVNSIEEAEKLSKEGFTIDEDVGLFLLNAIIAE